MPKRMAVINLPLNRRYDIPEASFMPLKHIMPFIECVDHDEYREPFLVGVLFSLLRRKASLM